MIILCSSNTFDKIRFTNHHQYILVLSLLRFCGKILDSSELNLSEWKYTIFILLLDSYIYDSYELQFQWWCEIHCIWQFLQRLISMGMNKMVYFPWNSSRFFLPFSLSIQQFTWQSLWCANHNVDGWCCSVAVWRRRQCRNGLSWSNRKLCMSGMNVYL